MKTINFDPEINKRVFDLINKRGITKYRISRDCKIPSSSLTQIENGVFGFKIEHLKNISQYLDVSIDYLITGELKEVVVKENSPINFYGTKIKPIPIVGSVGCGTSLKNWESYGNEFIELPDTGHMHSPFIVVAKGDSMRPYINPNDKLLCADQPELIKDGKAVIISFKTEPGTTDGNAKLIKFIENDMIMIYSVNTKYPPQFVHKKDIYHIFKLMRIIREVK